MQVGMWSGTINEWKALSNQDRRFFQAQQSQQPQQVDNSQQVDNFDVIIAKALASAIETQRTVRMVQAMSSLF